MIFTPEQVREAVIEYFTVKSWEDLDKLKEIRQNSHTVMDHYFDLGFEPIAISLQKAFPDSFGTTFPSAADLALFFSTLAITNKIYQNLIDKMAIEAEKK